MGNSDRSVSYGQRSGVGQSDTVTGEAMAIGCCQQTGGRGCGAGEDGGDNLRNKIRL